MPSGMPQSRHMLFEIRRVYPDREPSDFQSQPNVNCLHANLEPAQATLGQLLTISTAMAASIHGRGYIINKFFAALHKLNETSLEFFGMGEPRPDHRAQPRAFLPMPEKN